LIGDGTPDTERLGGSREVDRRRQGQQVFP
jgi:hypothetical protein